MSLTYTVYLHTCIISGKRYVGLTSKTMEERWSGHCYDARRGSRYHFHRAIAAYGVENWTHQVLAKPESLIEAAKLEQQFINEFRTFEPELGYNMTLGGEGPNGYRHTLETRQKMSQMRKGVAHGPPSLEHRKNLSLSRIGRKASDETRRKMRLTHSRPEKKSERSRIKSRPVSQLDDKGTILNTYPSVNAAAEASGGDKGCIAACARGSRNPKHVGFIWRYVDLMDQAP